MVLSGGSFEACESWFRYGVFHLGPESWLIQPDDFLVAKVNADFIMKFAKLLEAHPELVVEDVRATYKKMVAEFKSQK